MPSYVAPILISVLSAIGIDVLGYQQARKKWIEGGKIGPAPEFDVPLLMARAFIGLLAGVGITVTA